MNYNKHPIVLGYKFEKGFVSRWIEARLSIFNASYDINFGFVYLIIQINQAIGIN
jgi:hypothetical protein